MKPRALRVPVVALLLTVGCALATGEARADKRVALVIGNGAYQFTRKLANPPNDARAIEAKLRQLGFQVESAVDQGRQGMERAVRSFLRTLDGADVALLYYAGHGMQVGDRNYLVPVDAKLESEEDLEFETFEAQKVLEPMESRAKVGLVFLDACRDNPLANSIRRNSGRSMGRGLSVIKAETGEMLIAYATSPGQVAADGDGKNSPFTTAILEHIATPAIDVQTMLRRVVRSVEQQTGGKQVPWQHSSIKSDVYLGGAPQPAALVPASAASAPAVGAPNAASFELTFWTSIQSSTNPEDFADYLKRYPQGQFASLAQRRIEAMRQRTSASVASPAAPPQDRGLFLTPRRRLPPVTRNEQILFFQ